ncbi:MAG: hypothetical protein XD69_1191 [Clostridia bacterium 62_21]|nr:MAG: hypothetical protein XD69_1191 [Clostridia bacterium 62_21]
MKERILVLLGEMESVAQRQARLYERLGQSWER